MCVKHQEGKKNSRSNDNEDSPQVFECKVKVEPL